MNMLNPILDDILAVVDLAYDIMRETEESLAVCVALGNTEEASKCLSELHQLFTLQKDDFMSRLTELFYVGVHAQDNANLNLQKFGEEKVTFLKTSSEVARQELTQCILSLYKRKK